MRLGVVIPSKGRWMHVDKHPLARHALWIVPGNEVEHYRAMGVEACCEPPGTRSIPTLRQKIVERYLPDFDVLVQIDDDLHSVWNVMHEKSRKVEDPQEILEVLAQTGQMALDMELPVFGYNQTSHPMYADTQHPFRLRTWVYGTLGITRYAAGMRFDRVTYQSEDADFCLQSLERSRLCMKDLRWAFVLTSYPGGNDERETKLREWESAQELLKLWGPKVVRKNPRYPKRGMVFRLWMG